MQCWKNLLKNSITHPTQLPSHLASTEELNAVISQYPMRINPYYLQLIQKKGDPLWNQAVPSLKELNDNVCYEDPLNGPAILPLPGHVQQQRPALSGLPERIHQGADRS